VVGVLAVTAVSCALAVGGWDGCAAVGACAAVLCEVAGAAGVVVVT